MRDIPRPSKGTSLAVARLPPAFARVLLVDGVTAMRDFHRHQLRNSGFHNVFETSTSLAALIEARRQGFAMIVWAVSCDHAFEQLKQLIASGDIARCPIIVMAERGVAITTDHGAGISVLQKPASIATLRQASERLYGSCPEPVSHQDKR